MVHRGRSSGQPINARASRTCIGEVHRSSGSDVGGSSVTGEFIKEVHRSLGVHQGVANFIGEFIEEWQVSSGEFIEEWQISSGEFIEEWQSSSGSSSRSGKVHRG